MRGRCTGTTPASPSSTTPTPTRSRRVTFRTTRPTRYMGGAYRDTTSVYGPLFTLASEPVAGAAGILGGPRQPGCSSRWPRSRCAGDGGTHGAARPPARLRCGARRLESAAGAPLRGWWAQRCVDGATRDGGSRARRERTPAVERVWPGSPRSSSSGSRSSFCRCERSRPERGASRRSSRLRSRGSMCSSRWRALSSAGTGSGPSGALARNANKETEFALPHRLQELGVTLARWRWGSSPARSRLPISGWHGRRGAAARGWELAAGCSFAPRLTSMPWYAVSGDFGRGFRDDPPAQWLAVAISAYLLRQRVPI